ISDEEKERIKSRLNFLRKWVYDLAPKEKLINLSTGKMTDLTEYDIYLINDFIQLVKNSKLKENALIEDIKKLYTKNNLSVGEFHKKIYQFLFGKISGPRLVPYIQYAGEDKIIKRLESLLNL
ncbi:MAG: hypothetical protein ACW967_07520, partial [Candidatus Hodarchaeales archaeon]